MKQLRLLLWENCNRACPRCCNKQWDLSTLPVCTDYRPYDIIMLTGGEPMLFPRSVINLVHEIKLVAFAPVYLYTADVSNTGKALEVLKAVDGICVTLHTQADVVPFLRFAHAVGDLGRSLCLNIFSGVDIDLSLVPDAWKVKHMVWVADCPLPDNEVFMRLG